MIDVVEREDRATGTYIERLFEQHERRLGQFLVHVVRDRALAEDLLQETFLAAWRARNDLGEVVNAEAWLFGIARHRALRALRGASRMRRALERAGAVRETFDEGPALAIDTLALLHRVLGPGGPGARGAPLRARVRGSRARRDDGPLAGGHPQAPRASAYGPVAGGDPMTTQMTPDDQKLTELLAPLADIPPVPYRERRATAPRRWVRPVLVGAGCLLAIGVTAAAIVTSGGNKTPQPAPARRRRRRLRRPTSACGS